MAVACSPALANNSLRLQSSLRQKHEAGDAYFSCSAERGLRVPVHTEDPSDDDAQFWPRQRRRNSCRGTTDFLVVVRRGSVMTHDSIAEIGAVNWVPLMARCFVWFHRPPTPTNPPTLFPVFLPRVQCLIALPWSITRCAADVASLFKSYTRPPMWRSFALDVDVTSWRTPPSTRKFNDRDFIAMERFDGAGKASIWPSGRLRNSRRLPALGCFALHQTAVYWQFAQKKSSQVKRLPNTGCKRGAQLWFGSSFERKMESRCIYIYLFFDWGSKSWKLNASTVGDFWNFTGNSPVQAIYVLLNNKTEIKNTFKGPYYVVKYLSPQSVHHFLLLCVPCFKKCLQTYLPKAVNRGLNVLHMEILVIFFTIVMVLLISKMMVNGSRGLMREILSRGVFTNRDYGNDTSRRHNIDRCVCFARVRKTCQYNQAKMNVLFKQASLNMIITADTRWKTAKGEKDRSKTLASHRGVDTCAGATHTFSYHSLGYYDANC